MLRTVLDKFDSLDPEPFRADYGATRDPRGQRETIYHASPHVPSFDTKKRRHMPMWVNITIGLVAAYVVYRIFLALKKFLGPKKQDEEKQNVNDAPRKKSKTTQRKTYPQPQNDPNWSPLPSLLI